MRALEAVDVEVGRGRASPGFAGTEREHRRRISCCWRWASSVPSAAALLAELGVRLTERGNVWRDERWMTSEEGVFTAGDMQRGQSLIVWAIADGRTRRAASTAI